MEENKKNDAPPPNSPHKAFWMSMSYSDFTTGNVPGVLDPVTKQGIKILQKGNAAESSLILALKGEGPLFDPARGAFGRMPAGNQTPFTPEEITELSNWIDKGCPEF
ncbi:MAG: hypothetical protein EOO01_34980 [Chitinophagaceae bacterium]|nr:MAG: hypothetical protein EOO01_34980 [Chitinophagaceae bacterium]